MNRIVFVIGRIIYTGLSFALFMILLATSPPISGHTGKCRRCGRVIDRELLRCGGDECIFCREEIRHE